MCAQRALFVLSGGLTRTPYPRGDATLMINGLVIVYNGVLTQLVTLWSVCDSVGKDQKNLPRGEA